MLMFRRLITLPPALMLSPLRLPRHCARQRDDIAADDADDAAITRYAAATLRCCGCSLHLPPLITA